VWGGSEADRSEASLRLAAAMLCSGGNPPCGVCAHCGKAFRRIHPDITVLDRLPDKREILVDQIRSLREDAIILPNEADRKVYIIQHADAMNTAAQNAILKLLEEPPSSVSIILEADNPVALLSTVRSRCAELPAGSRDAAAPAGSEDKAVKEAVRAFCGVLSDNLALATLTFTLEKMERSKFADFIDSAKASLTASLRDKTTADPALPLKAIAVLDRARDYFAANVGLGHITGMICAELITAADTGTKPRG
jgi:DNA polymerase-3 subunit delta'